MGFNLAFKGLNVTEINIFYTHYEKIHNHDHVVFIGYYAAATVSLHKP